MGVGNDAPEWGDLARGPRPDFDPMVDRLPGTSRQGWQEKASDAVENDCLRMFVPLLDPLNRLSFVPSPMAGLPFTRMPINMESRFQPQELRVLFLRRLWQPLPCGRPLNSRGLHRAACPLARSVGAPRFFAAERSRSGLPGGGGSGHNKRSSPGYGPRPPLSSRQQQIGGGR